MIPTIRRLSIEEQTLVGVLLAAAFGQVFWTRNHFLDDAFIHLRIAEQVRDSGFFSFNGTAPDFSTSSILYTSLLGILSKLHSSPWLPKFANVVVYLTTIGVLMRLMRDARNHSERSVVIAFLATVMSPFAVRWLTDGMETSLVALDAILLAKFLSFQGRSLRRRLFAVFLVSLASVLLRVEMGFILAIAVVGKLSDGLIWAEPSKISFPARMRESLPFALGGALGLSVIFWVFGHVLPDTSLAKQGAGSIDLIGTLRTAIQVHVAASSFGAGLLVLLFVSFTLALYRADSNRLMYVLVTNSAFPVFLLLVVVRKQALQGVRYFVFIEFFLITLNLLTIRAAGVWLTPFQPSLRRARVIVYAGVALWFLFDLRVLGQVYSGRSETFLKFVKGDFKSLSGRTGVAWDVGMIGYFSQAAIIDPNGLVNGRDWARLSSMKRLQLIGEQKIDFAFVNDSQRGTLARVLDLSQFASMAEFAFPNAGGNRDIHYLLARQ